MNIMVEDIFSVRYIRITKPEGFLSSLYFGICEVLRGLRKGCSKVILTISLEASDDYKEIQFTPSNLLKVAKEELNDTTRM